MPNYGALDDKEPDSIGYYERERTCRFVCQRWLLGGSAVLFILIGIAAIVLVAFFDLFLLSLWPNLFYSSIGFAIGLVVAGCTGSLAVHTRNKAALYMFAFFALCMIGASVVLIIFVWEEQKDSSLGQIEEQWQRGIDEKGSRLDKICELQHDLNCVGWIDSCTPGADPELSDAEVQGLIKSLRDRHDNSKPQHTGHYWFGNSSNGTNGTNITTPAPVTESPGETPSPGGTFSPAERRSRLCPTCASVPPNPNGNCHAQIRNVVDDAAPVLTAVAVIMIVMLLCMLAWSYKIRRRTRRSAQEEPIMASPSRYL